MYAGTAEIRQQTGHRRRVARGDWLAAAFILVAALVNRGVWIGDPVADFDEQLYSFIGWRMTHGELPYVDWWDRKPFGLFAIFALAHAAGGPGAAAYQVAAFLSTLSMAALSYGLARRLVDRFSAAMAAAIGVVLLSAYGGFSANSEVFFVPLTLAMVWLLADPRHPHARRRAVMAMLIGGIALQIKYSVLPVCAALGMVALWQEWARSRSVSAVVLRAILFAAAGLVATMLVALFYATTGHWDEWVFANFVSFFDRVPADSGRFRESFTVLLLPVALCLVGGLYGALRLVPPKDKALYALVVVYAIGMTASAFLPGTVYPYYFAAFAGPAPLVALPFLDRRGPGGVIPASALFLLMTALVNPLGRFEQSRDQRADVAALAVEIAPYVDGASRCMWIHDGPTVLYRLSGSCVPTRFVYPDHLNNALETPALGIDQTAEAARILSLGPPVIVTADEPVTIMNPEVSAMVRTTLDRDYTPIGSAIINDREITAWARRDSEVRQTGE